MSEFLWVSAACFHKEYGFANLQSAEKHSMEILSKGNLIFEYVVKYMFQQEKKRLFVTNQHAALMFPFCAERL